MSEHELVFFPLVREDDELEWGPTKLDFSTTPISIPLLGEASLNCDGGNAEDFHPEDQGIAVINGQIIEAPASELAGMGLFHLDVFLQDPPNPKRRIAVVVLDPLVNLSLISLLKEAEQSSVEEPIEMISGSFTRANRSELLNFFVEPNKEALSRLLFTFGMVELDPSRLN